jgi:hypothetical protein
MMGSDAHHQWAAKNLGANDAPELHAALACSLMATG